MTASSGFYETDRLLTYIFSWMICSILLFLLFFIFFFLITFLKERKTQVNRAQGEHHRMYFWLEISNHNARRDNLAFFWVFSDHWGWRDGLPCSCELCSLVSRGMPWRSALAAAVEWVGHALLPGTQVLGASSLWAVFGWPGGSSLVECHK